MLKKCNDLISGGSDIDHQLAEAKKLNKNKEPSQVKQSLNTKLFIRAKAVELRKATAPYDSDDNSDNEWNQSP